MPESLAALEALEALKAIEALLPLHWLRPWALLGLLPALALLLWRRRPGDGAVPPGVIDARLLPHLLVRGGPPARLRPADTLAVALACFSVALAGPAWQREASPLALEAAPLMLVLDLSESMDAADLPPSRLDHARAKLQRLLEQRAAAPTGLIVYAGSAHLVLPPTQDREVLATYLDALGTALMPQPGNAPAEALALALQWLGRAPVAGTVLFLTAEWPAADLERAESLLRGTRQRLAVWAIGTREGGPLRDADGSLRTDAQGRSRSARLDVAGLDALRARTGAALVAVTPDDGDLARVQALIARHRTEAAEQDPTLRWHDRGPLFIWPGLLALLLSLRRGWVLRWQAAGVLLALAGLLSLGAAPAPAMAREAAVAPAPVASTGAARSADSGATAAASATANAGPTGTVNAKTTASATAVSAPAVASLGERFFALWLTPDQRGRWWLERGDPQRAARHFADPFWRGIAHARAGQWQAAADAFARVDSPAAWFNQAQMLARLGRYSDAVASYDQALLRLPGWPQAQADRERVRALIPPTPPGDPEDGELQPGEGDRSEPGARRPRRGGPPRPLTEAELAELWLQRLDTSPAGFLQRKFAQQAQRSGEAAPARPLEVR